MTLSRLPGEKKTDYQKRLVYGKLIDKTLADVDYSELAQLVYGQTYSSDVARRMMYGSCRTMQLYDEEAENSICDDDLLAELEAKRVEVQKERYRFFDQRNAYNKIVRSEARRDELKEIIERAIMSGSLHELEYDDEACIRQVGDNDLLVSLNDIHYGANISNKWNVYNSDICKEMMQRYLERVIAIGATHCSENCIVWANGDLISGSIHKDIAVSNKENVIEQIVGVSELITTFLAELSRYFVNVTFVSVAGNHSRLEKKEDALKDERLDDLVEWYLKARLQNIENISIGCADKIDSTMYLINVRGKNFVGVHGDYDGSKEKLSALKSMVGVDVYGILLGHMHHNAVDEVQGVKTIMAGSFMGMDDFCVTKRIFGHPQQLVLVCGQEGVRCYYDICLKA